MLTSQYALKKLLIDHSLYITQIFINTLDINAVNAVMGTLAPGYTVKSSSLFIYRQHGNIKLNVLTFLACLESLNQSEIHTFALLSFWSNSSLSFSYVTYYNVKELINMFAHIKMSHG